MDNTKTLNDLRNFAKRAAGDTPIVVNDGEGILNVTKLSMIRDESGSTLVLEVK